MFKVSITDAVISKGFDGKPAFNFNANKTAVNFKIGYRVYDKNSPDNYRFVNFAVKAYNHLSERIEKMNPKEGSRVHIWGKMDEDVWEDENGQKQSRYVIIVEDIEYALKDTNKPNGSGTSNTGSTPPDQNGVGQGEEPPNGQTSQPQQNSQGDQPGEPPSGFIGYDNFGKDGSGDLFP